MQPHCTSIYPEDSTLRPCYPTEVGCYSSERPVQNHERQAAHRQPSDPGESQGCTGQSAT